jgi:hypothetical protein
MYTQDEPQYVYQNLLSISEAIGWRAVFVERYAEGYPYLSEEPLIGWGRTQMIGVFEGGQERLLEVDVLGLIAREEVVSADMLHNFMGYAGPGEDRNIYLEEASVKLAEAEQAASEPDEEDEEDANSAPD